MKPLLAFLLFLHAAAVVMAAEENLELSGSHVRISWTRSIEGWKISRLQLRTGNSWQTVAHPSGEYTLLYTDVQPADSSAELFTTVAHTPFPDPLYKYQIRQWRQSVSPVSLNTAGEATSFFPAAAKAVNRSALVFTQETKYGTVTATWTLDEQFPGDIKVTQTLTAKTDGWYSLASPALVTIPEQEMAWVTVPGYFQGNAVEPNMVLAYGYGQGVPARPVVYRERCAGSFCPVVSTKDGLSLAAIPEPGLGRDPWAYDQNTHQDWQLGISHRNRKAALSPTLYYPVLGEPLSQMQKNNTISYGFRYTLLKGEWYQVLSHAVNDVYRFKATLALRKNRQSLVSRVEAMRHYLSDRKTSLWNVETYNGLQIGGQSYLGGVVGSNHDAIKNSDYGAMWMLAHTANDRFLKDSVLPYALNFKLAQQQTGAGFFQGAAMGQYYLAKSKKFVEEWGEFVEPVSLTYYIMLDIGNILLFEPSNRQLRDRLRLGAGLLLKWQKADGSWDVAYDRHTQQPLFTDLQDLRPTFYGLLVAYRILKEEKYLAAARKGADWFIQQAVNKGRFIGVCGDARYAPDFATAQSAQALLDLYDITKEEAYRSAAIRTARMYLTSIYTQPVASTKMKIVKGVQRQDWQISQSGLSFEHGGILGSANGAGPILLCSHAGMFVRMFQLTGDSLFVEMARAAAIGRDAFVDSATSVASYYWNAMNKGAGPYPHHAWWQIGWITDYLMAEMQLRSNNRILFPRGFVTPKVGPHESYGFAAGAVYGEPARLIIREGLVQCSNPNMEYITALSVDGKKLFVVLLNDTGETTSSSFRLQTTQLGGAGTPAFSRVKELTTGSSHDYRQLQSGQQVQLEGYGIKVYRIE
jgi:hypothetical protein